MKASSLDKPLIERLIEERFGTKTAFHETGAVDKATLGRWFSGKSHPSSEKYLEFCGALNVDPLALLSIHPDRMPTLVLKAIVGIGTGRWGKELGMLSFLQGLIPGRQLHGDDYEVEEGGDTSSDTRPDDDHWPSEKMPSKYLDERRKRRTWSKLFHKHDPSKEKHSYYGAFLLRPSIAPQVFYFAFRKEERPYRDWWWYGYVRSLDDEVSLLHFTSQRMTASASSDGSLAVETYLESVPIDFQIFSIHPFEASFCKRLPEEWDGRPVRFVHPRFP